MRQGGEGMSDDKNNTANVTEDTSKNNTEKVNGSKEYTNKIFWCFVIVIVIIAGLFVLYCTHCNDLEWNFLFVTVGTVAIGMCVMICTTVMCIKCLEEKAKRQSPCEIDKEIIAAALKVDTSIICQCKCNRNKDCECRKIKKE